MDVAGSTDSAGEHLAPLSHDQCYAAIERRDARFDGWFVTAVRTTRIYCRPSCPAVTPRRANVSFFASAAAAQRRGFRACKRCRPDASPGSPEWDLRTDVVARAMRAIADGVVDREGVRGLAARLGYSERHLNRLVTDELGAGPLAIARAQRAHTARVLVETTDLPLAEVAFAAGFASTRQFNDTFREVYAMPPSELRRSVRRPSSPALPGSVALRLPVRAPFAADELFAFLATRAVTGVEHWDGATFTRTLRLHRGPAVVTLRAGAANAATVPYVECRLRLTSLADLQAAVHRCRRLLDLDADPQAVDEHLAGDETLAPLVRERPGLRSPGAVDGAELLVRAILGQQVSVAGARTIAGRLAARFGEVVDLGEELPVARLFPSADALAEVPAHDLPMPAARRRSLIAACTALAEGTLVIDGGADRGALDAALQHLPGIGPWTAAYVRLRALGDPDVFMATDLGVRHALAAAGLPASPRDALARAERWRPYRSYAQHHLWASL